MEHQTAQHPQYPVYYPQVAPPPPAVVHDGSGATVGLADVGEYGANGGGYGVYQGGMGQNGNNNTLDMNMRPPMPMQPIPQYQMQHQHQHQHQAVQQHPTQPQPITYADARHQAMYSQPIPTTSPMPPASPYEPISPAHSYSDHSHSGTESVGHIGGGVPTGRPAHYGHAHSLSSSSSGSSHHSMVQGHYPPMSGENPMHFPSRGRPRRDRRPPSTPPHMQGRELPSPTSDEDPSFAPIFSRKENTRRQRIEAEQRRRDELRDGYSRLKDVLPISATKSSKVNLIERARSHILDVEKENETLKGKVAELEREVQRLRDVSDKLMMSVAQPLQPLPSNGSPPHPTLIPGGITVQQQAQAEQDQLAYDADEGEEYLDGQTPLAGQESDVAQYLEDGNSPIQHV